MTLTASEIYDRLTEMDGDEQTAFELQPNLAVSDVESWYANIDLEALKTEVDTRFERTAVTDLTAPQGIGGDNLSVADVIKSRNDDPSDYDSAYIMRSDRTVVQYFRPYIGGREPIPESEVDAAMESHVDDLVTQAVDGEILARAQTEFGV